MAITSISRDWGVSPSIVRVTSTDSLATVSAVGYLASQASNIAAVQHTEVQEPFQWAPTDMVAMAYNGGFGLFTPNLVSGSFVANVSSNLLQAHVTLTAAQIITMYDTPIEVIAPVAGMIIVPTGFVWNFIYGSAQFTGGGAVALQYGNPAHGLGVNLTAGIAAASVNGVAANSVLTDTFIPVVTTSALSVNQGVYISNVTADFAVGTGMVTTLNVPYILMAAV